MPRLTIIRVGQSTRGTFGVLLNGQVPFALTLERPWVNNEKIISCIPTGTYTCARVRSPKFGNTFEVEGVPGRSAILFHRGNDLYDTQGCILVGEEFSGTPEAPRISSSERGFADFLTLLDGHQGFELTIRDASVHED